MFRIRAFAKHQENLDLCLRCHTLGIRFEGIDFAGCFFFAIFKLTVRRQVDGIITIPGPTGAMMRGGDDGHTISFIATGSWMHFIEPRTKNMCSKRDWNGMQKFLRAS